jgi:hypothetical protein
MLVSHFLDLVPIWLMLIGTILMLVFFIEYGFRLGRKAQTTSRKAQTSQVRAIMGAGLGLLAFMLAFTFSTAQSHFEARVQTLVEEARIVRNAFIRANLLKEPIRTEAKTLLKEYVDLRRESTETSDISAEVQLTGLLERAEQIQHRLMLLAIKTDKAGEDAGENDGSLNLDSPFAASVLLLTDIHYTRLHSVVMNRIPLTIWMTLYLMAILSMTIMGYQAGLTDKRSPVATITLAVAFSAVIILITDLDRPIMSFFDINDQLLVDLYEYMEADLRLEYYTKD